MTTVQRNVPTQADWDWGHEKCLDHWECEYEYYRQMFLGKGIQEMVLYLADNPAEAWGALYCMPKVPFRYYVFAFKILLLGEGQPGNVTYCPVPSEVASCLLSLIKIKLEESPNVILPVMEELMPVAEYVAANQEMLEANIDIFGSFAEKVDEIKRLYAESQAAVAMPPDVSES
jgi:hypothetical protein